MKVHPKLQDKSKEQVKVKLQCVAKAIETHVVDIIGDMYNE